MARLTPCVVLFLLGVLLGAASVNAQEPVSGAILNIDDTSFPDVQVILNVLGPGNRPVTGLGPEAFSAEETRANASVSKVETVLNQQIGVGVILVVDSSGSMAGQPITQAKNAASAFVRNLQPTDQVAILSFANEVVVQDGLSTNRETSLAALNRVTAVGNTALYSAVAESVNRARDVALPRKAIILLSDGLDAGGVSKENRQQSLAAAEEGRIPIYTIGLGVQIDRPFLQELSRVSGGAFFETPAPSGVAALYEQLSLLLRSQYVLTVRSTAPADVVDRSLTVAITSPAGSTQVRADYKTRRRIQPLPPPAPAPPPAVAIVPPAPKEPNNTPLLILMALLALGGAVGGGSFLYSRLKDRKLSEELAVLSQRAEGDLGFLPAERGPATNRHIFLSVEGPKGSRRVRVGEEPTTIGRGSGSQLLLEDDADVVAEAHARVWSMDGKLMFHQLARGKTSLVGGNPVTWVSLDKGDEVRIGPYTLRVEVE